MTSTYQYDKIQYLVALISEFAAHFGLSDSQAARYMTRYGAVELCDKHYNVMHTLPWLDNIQSIATFCRRKGGLLSFSTMSQMFRLMPSNSGAVTALRISDKHSTFLPIKVRQKRLHKQGRTFLEVHQLLILSSSTSKCFQKAFSITNNFIITVLNGRSLYGTTAMRNALSFIPIITISFMVQ